MSWPSWPAREWLAMIALVASIAGSAVLTAFSMWLVMLVVGFARAEAALRPRAIEMLAASNYGLLAIIGAILLSLGLAINRRSLKASAFGASLEADGGGHDRCA